MAGLRELKVLILGDATGAETAFGKLKASSTDAASVGGAALAGIGAIAVAVGGFALDMADKYETSHARLTAALADTGQSWDAVSAQVKNTDSAMEHLGFTNAQTEDALSRLELATHSNAAAQRDLAIAADLARARGMDLSSAAQLVGKVSEGTYTQLTRLGIASKDLVKSFTDPQQALDYLSKMFGGQASTYAETFSGKLAVLKAQVEDAGKNLGMFLIPKVEALIGFGADTVNFFERNRLAADALGVAVGGPLVYAMGVYLVQEAAVVGVKLVEFFTSVGSAVSGLAAAYFGTAEATEADVASTLADLQAKTALAVKMGYLTAAEGEAAAATLADAAAEDTASVAAAGAAGAFSAMTAAIGLAILPLGALLGALKAFQVVSGDIRAHGIGSGIGDIVDPARAADTGLRALTNTLGPLVGIHHSAATATHNFSAANLELAQSSKAAEIALTSGAASGVQDVAAVDAAQQAWSKQFETSLAAAATAATNLQTSLMASFSSSTSVVSAFGSSTKVTIDQINGFFYSQLIAVQNWSTNLQKLISAGLNVGLLKELADAGPKAAGLVQGMVDDVSKNGVAAINSAYTSTQAILKSTVGEVTGYEGQFAAAGASLIDGMAAGVWAREAGLINAVTGVTNTALLRAKQANGISSPAKRWADEIGVPIAHGIAAGITSGSGAMHSAVDALTRPPQIFAGVPVGGGGGNTYQITVNALDPRTAGTLVVQAVREYERTNGAGWRKPSGAF